MSAGPELLRRLRAALAEAGDPARAKQQQAYMKSELPFHGVATPVARPLARRVFAETALADRDAWREAILHLWRKAKFREERYAAIALAQDRRFAKTAAPDLLPLYEELIVTGAWWDFVDELADRCVGPLVRAFPLEVKPEMLRWSQGDDLWKRRTSIICQLGAKGETDTDLLTRCIAPSLGSKEFFLRKAIGWALRQYARTEPEWVRAYVRKHDAALSPLSKREAMKHL